MIFTRNSRAAKRLGRSALFAVIGFLLLSFSAATPVAYAHAILVSSTPAQGENLDALPANIVLEFTEPIGLEFSTINLYSAGSKELPGGQVTRSGGRDITVVLPTGGQSATGVLYVVWRVVSGVDGHLTSGSYWFTVGAEFANSRPQTGSFPGQPPGLDEPFGGTSSGPDLPRLIARFLAFATSALLLGGSVFTVLMVEPSASSTSSVGAPFDSHLNTRFAAVGAGAAGVLALALLIDLIGQTATIAGTDYIGAFGRLELTQLLLSTTRYGLAWLLKLLAALGLAAIMLFVWANRKANNAWEVAIAAASLLLLAEALSSHAAAAQSGSIGGLPIPVISDWLHLVVASLWAGGLLYMVTTLFPVLARSGSHQPERLAFLRSIIPRFSRLAIASVLILAVTGSYNLLVHTSDVRALFDVDYGWVLGLKVSLFVAVVAIGARSFILFRPAPRSSGIAQDAGAESKLTRNVHVEVLLVLCALFSAGALTLLPPPAATSEASSPSPEASTLASGRSAIGNYEAMLSVKTTGAEEFFEVLFERKSEDASGLTDTSRVFLRITPQEGRIVTSSVDALRLRGANEEQTAWRAPSSLTAPAASYLVVVVAQRSNSDDLKVGFRLTRGADGTITIMPWQLVEVRISTEPDPPIVGENMLRIRTVDAGGQPVSEATGAAVLEHPASGTTRPEVELTKGDPDDGNLTSKVTFDQPGAWRIIIRVHTPGQDDVLFDTSLDISE